MNKSTNKNDKKGNMDKKGKKIENTARARALARHCQRLAEGVVPSHHSRDTDRMRPFVNPSVRVAAPRGAPGHHHSKSKPRRTDDECYI